MRMHANRLVAPEECIMRPSLSKKVFPVRRVTPKKASREVGFFFVCFSVFHFSLTRMY